MPLFSLGAYFGEDDSFQCACKVYCDDGTLECRAPRGDQVGCAPRHADFGTSRD